MSIYNIEVKEVNGESTSMEKYKDKVLLIVNTATGCGFTPQYKGLQSLYEEYKDQGFEVLDFPCNQFGHQAPGSDEEIEDFCTLNYDTTFPRFKKIDVNGENEDPLFSYLKEETAGKLGGKIKWNFTKFLVDRDGNVVKRFAPTKKPEDIRHHISKLISK